MQPGRSSRIAGYSRLHFEFQNKKTWNRKRQAIFKNKIKAFKIR
jgi:hypothetical protein